MERASAAAVPASGRRPARLLRITSDERLVALVRDGDEAAFEALYDRHQAAILGFCRHMLGTREEAEDALQHTFLDAFRDVVGSTKPIELRPWLFAIARNRCLSLLRMRRAHVALDATEPATDGLAVTVERREDVRELLADLARLPEDQRAALLLAEVGALDHAGIATVLGCRREKVKALVFQARSSLAASREARATPCEQIRLELATATGGALRRGPLRRHLRACPGCSTFKAEVAAQRRLLALALPVVPSAALKAGVLSAAGAHAGGGVGLGGVGSAAAGASASGGALSAIASTGAAKAGMALALAAAIAGGGSTLASRHRHASAAHPPVPASGQVAEGAPARGQPAPPRHAVSGGASAPRAVRRRPAGDRPSAPAHAIASPTPRAAPAPTQDAAGGTVVQPPSPSPAGSEPASPPAPPPQSHVEEPAAGEPPAGNGKAHGNPHSDGATGNPHTTGNPHGNPHGAPPATAPAAGAAPAPPAAAGGDPAAGSGGAKHGQGASQHGHAG